MKIMENDTIVYEIRANDRGLYQRRPTTAATYEYVYREYVFCTNIQLF